MKHCDPATLVSVTLYNRDAYLEKFPFGYTNASGSFKCVSNNPELEFDYSSKNAERVLRKYGKAEIPRQYNTNKGGNRDNEIAYAVWLANRDGIDLDGFVGSVEYTFVKLHDYKQLVKRCLLVTFRHNSNSKIKPIVIKIPHTDYDATLPAVEWELIEEFTI